MPLKKPTEPPPEAPELKVVSYARKSPPEKKKDEPLAQHGVNAQHAKQNGLTIVSYVSEVCRRDATLSERPVLRSVLGKNLLVRDLCRLACDPVLVPTLLAVCAKGGQVYSTRRDEEMLLRRDLDDPYVRGELGKIGIKDAIERAETRRRLELTRQHIMALGGYGGGYDTRYGYTLTWVDDRRVFLPDPDEHPILMRMVAERDAGRYWYEIADDLNRDGIPTATGRGSGGQRPSEHASLTSAPAPNIRACLIDPSGLWMTADVLILVMLVLVVALSRRLVRGPRVRSDFYRRYINSSAWRATRTQRLRLAGYRCEHYGPLGRCHAMSRLQVHHLHYRTLGHEDVERDLRVLCRRHHVRADRHRRRWQGRSR